MASIVDVGGSKYLDVKLHQGCVGTVGEKGCGLLGALPLFGVSDAATLEYTCALCCTFSAILLSVSDSGLELTIPPITRSARAHYSV